MYTFARTGATARTETAKLTASDGVAGDSPGYSVAIDSDMIVAGARGADTTLGANIDQGAVYIFARTGAAARTETTKLTASDGGQKELGSSVASSSDTIVAGAPGGSGGSAYVFTPPFPSPPPPGDALPPPPPLPPPPSGGSNGGTCCLTHAFGHDARFAPTRRPADPGGGTAQD